MKKTFYGTSLAERRKQHAVERRTEEERTAQRTRKEARAEEAAVKEWRFGSSITRYGQSGGGKP